MTSLALLFVHLLAGSMALGAIVATDLRLLSKLAQDRVRIAPPNRFVTRIVTIALIVLCLSGVAIVWLASLERPDSLANPKLQAKIALVLLLTVNAFVLHRFTFPRLARGRRVAKWQLADWLIVAVPVAASNFLWLFVAFLGIARAWNHVVPLRDILWIAACGYAVVQIGLFAILAIAGRPVDPAHRRFTDVMRRTLASIGELGTPIAPVRTESAPVSRRRPALRLVAGSQAGGKERRSR